MSTRNSISVLVIVASLLAGCDDPPDADLTPIMAPVENRDSKANEFRDQQLTEEQAAALARVRVACKGELSKLLEHGKWSGHRMRVTGMRDGLPVSESVGPWHILLVPTPDKSIVEIRGLLFAKDFTVKLDVDRNVLIIKDTEFTGRPLTGKSPLFQNTAFQGIAFEGELGSVMGSASILFLEDGQVCMDFHKVFVNGSKAGEYGVLEASAVGD